MPAPRQDTRGIVNAADLLSRVRFRRHEPAPELRPYLEHYWLIDWDLPQPYATHVVPHPSVNIVFQRYARQEPFAEVAGVGLDLFSQEITAVGRVCGVQFRPGGFRPFAPQAPVAEWTGRRLALPAVFPDPAHAPALAGALDAVLAPDDDHVRVAALDALLLGLGPHGRGPEPDPQADLAMTLVDRIRRDRSIRRVGDFARDQELPVRSLQRLFAAYVGVGPKWIILRYRIHEALERAEDERAVDWAGLAADLGYADQAHLVRDFTATIGVPPTVHAAH
ncbi:AraC family transcriptional regulator [Streptomyces sp. NPDC002454]|uniref:AraC family transcriptional regulator n=1 Tax=Streptomyces sp. NPDC002490 TaxID=3154416 RepID=UPI00332C217F